jgi:hypothetical protein
LLESYLLKRWEKSVAKKAICVAVSEKDKMIYKEQLNAISVEHLPVFIANQKVESKPGLGNYCIYHGNLSVNENEQIVLWLINNVYKFLFIPLVIAGKNPSASLLKAVQQNKNICIEANPSAEKMKELILNAQINILPSANSAGVKIKLLNAIFNGRHCVVNKNTITGTGLNDVCNIAETPHEFINAIEELYKLPFTPEDILKRQTVLNELYNNKQNAIRLIHLLY